MRFRLLLVMMLALPLFAGLADPAAAQRGRATTPEMTTLDLAAMSLPSSEVPDTYQLRTERSYVTGQVGGQLFNSDIIATRLENIGLIGWYQSEYYDTVTATTLTIAIAVYADEDGAREGYDLLHSGGSLGFTDARPLTGIGEEPSGLFVDSFEITDGFVVSAADAVFRVGPMLGSVSLANTGPAFADPDVAEELAARLANRMFTAQDGDALSAADLSLAERLAPGRGLVALQEGFIDANEALPANAGLDALDFSGGYLRTYEFGFPTTPDDAPGLLFVHTALLSFADAESALRAHYRFEDIPLLSPLPPSPDSPRMQGNPLEINTRLAGDVQRAGVAQIAVIPGGPLDSVRAAVLLGDEMLIVEIAGAANLNLAREVATNVLNDLLRCVVADRCRASASITTAPDTALILAEPVATAGDWPRHLEDERETFDSVWETVKHHYAYRTGHENILYANYKEVDWGAVRETHEPLAIAAAEAGDSDAYYAVLSDMVGELDDQHSAFIDPDRATFSRDSIWADTYYVGIGAITARGLDQNDPGLVLYVFPDSPAAVAGIARRDRIVAVNGETLDISRRDLMRELHREVLRRDLPDDAGAPLTLTVLSPGQEARDIEVERSTGSASVIPVAHRLEADPSIGYLQITEFGSFELVPMVERALEELLDGPIPLNGLVIDVRGNPGGFIYALNRILGNFVVGEVGRFYLRDGTIGDPSVIEPSRLYEDFKSIPIVVVTDDRMYSAAESTAAILQSQERATIVGVRSPGDVEVVTSFDQPDGSAVALAFGLYVPGGMKVEGRGVIPDIEVNVDWTRYTELDDPHLLTAITVIRGEPKEIQLIPPAAEEDQLRPAA